MNLKGFKKVHEDNEKAVLKNHKGHEITIAKKALSGNHLKDLQKLKLHASDGTDTDPNALYDQPDPNAEDYETGQPVSVAAGATPGPHSFMDPEAIYPSPLESTKSWLKKSFPTDLPENRQTEQADSGVQGPEQPTDNYQDQIQTQDAQQTQSEAPVPQPQPTRQAASSPSAQPQSTQHEGQEYQNSFNDTLNQNQAERGREDAAFYQDLKNGHITPETYADLFGKKDTLGKIGTLFGLMLSGAGSGLAHQPNALLDMMNKELDRDLEAQKQSKANAMNFLKIGQARALNEANIKKINQDTELGKASTANAWQTNTINSGTITAMHHLGLISDSIPPNNPIKPAVTQAVGQAQMAGAQQVQQRNQHAAALTTAAQMDSRNQSQQGMTEDQYGQNINDWRNAAIVPALSGFGEMKAKDLESKYLPGIGYAQIPVESKDRDKMTMQQNLLQKSQELRQWAQQHSGSLDPRIIAEGETKSKLLQDAYRQANGEGVFRKGESAFINGIIESEPAKFFNKWRVDPKFKALETGINTDLNSLQSKYRVTPFSGTKLPGNQSQQPQAQSSGQGQIQYMGGVPHRQVPGGWMPIGKTNK